jgi:hypothetical protein
MPPWADDFVTSAGRLVEVRGQRAACGYVVLELVFTHGVLRLSSDPDTDEIVVEPHESTTSGLADVSSDEPLRAGIGKVIEYAWCMTNHRGFDDAFQVRLVNLDDRSEAARQFEVAASVIHVRSVAE